MDGVALPSHPARGAWIEITFTEDDARRWTKSHPARGAWIEIENRERFIGGSRSHPARGAWIEIRQVELLQLSGASHPARGAWIEIDSGSKEYKDMSGRTPQGVRGLKYWQTILWGYEHESHPARGAWIEISFANF